MTHDDHARAPEDPTGSRLTRRGLLKAAGAAGLAMTSAGLLAPASYATPADAIRFASNNGNPATPKPGGSLSIGILGNGTSETYNPALINTNVDIIHAYSVFDPLTRFGPNHTFEPGLAIAWTPNKDATVWEIKLREGVVWHDGKPFTAEDVLYTLRLMGSPSNLGYPAVQNVQLNGIKALGKYIVQVPLKTADALFQLNFFVNSGLVVQNGFKDFSKPIGTGPFKLQSFTPGQRSILTANRDYWDHPRPYLDEFQIISIDDDGARLNALMSGQIDVASPILAAEAKANLGASNGVWQVVVGAPGVTHTINMRCDQPPFTDVRVRQAMKLIADRPALIDAAFSGFGQIANDIIGKGLEYYDSSLPQRVQDIEQAKSLLKAAGQSNLHTTLQTANVSTGVVEAATAFAQQATAAGVNIKVKQDTPAAYFNPQLLYTHMPFAQDIWTSTVSLEIWYHDALVIGAPYNETHWHSASFDALVTQAQSTLEHAKAQELWSQLQTIQYNQGGYIIWADQSLTDGISTKVAGYGGPGTGWTGYPDDARVYNWGFAQ